MEKTTRIILGGDVMLGRLVKKQILSHGSDYPLGKIAHILRTGDLTIANLECAITPSDQIWSGSPKAFYFGAPPAAANALKEAGIDLVSLANNHTLDFDIIGLEDTLRYLQQQQISYTGAGKNLAEALTPAIIERNQIKFGMVAFCDHQEDFAANAKKPGIAYLDLSNRPQVLAQFANSLTVMEQAKVDWPILSLHWGPNMVNRPSPYFIELAHAAIDLGFKMIFGHSAHVFHGIEIYRDCPIFYAAGDLVDDYYVDPEFKNDHQLLFEIQLCGTKVKRIDLHPVFIDYCQVKPAIKENFKYIADRAITLCQEMGTQVKRLQDNLIIEIENKS